MSPLDVFFSTISYIFILHMPVQFLFRGTNNLHISVSEEHQIDTFTEALQNLPESSFWSLK